jgi:hypothetical protein
MSLNRRKKKIMEKDQKKIELLLKPKDPELHCECGHCTWIEDNGSRRQCPNCERIYEKGKLLWMGPSEGLYGRLWNPAMNHFNRIHREMGRIERKLDKMRSNGRKDSKRGKK